MEDLKCPYCGKRQEPEHEFIHEINQNEFYPHECKSCSKTFTYTTTIICLNSERKADCLNGGEHKWEKVVCIPNFFPNRRRCQGCGLEERGEIDLEMALKIQMGESNE